MGKRTSQKKLTPPLTFKIKGLVILSFFIYSLGFATSLAPTIGQTKQQLKQLDAKIEQLKKNLTEAQSSHQAANNQLSLTEKELNQSISKLKILRLSIAKKQNSINHYTAKYESLNKKLVEQQLLLKEHARAFYMMGDYQPLKWMLNKDDPCTVNRLLTYYQYLTRSRLSLIEAVTITQQQIHANQASLNAELQDARQLQLALAKHQDELNLTKKQHTHTLDTLDQTIRTSENTLSEFQRNKANLSKLLENLSSQNSIAMKKPFSTSRHHLMLPLPARRQAIKAINQGLLFPATEGTPVRAVYPGKIVFSDWLNGYGLLLIIDHGQGFMTLYAHNQSLYKTKGSLVKQGDVIAGVGHNVGENHSGLYFEIRQHGKVVAPITWFF